MSSSKGCPAICSVRANEGGTNEPLGPVTGTNQPSLRALIAPDCASLSLLPPPDEPHAVTMPAGFSTGHWGTLMPFVKACERSGPPPPRPRARPDRLLPPAARLPSEPLCRLGLAPTPVRADGSLGRDWATAMMSEWPTVSEGEAHRAMNEFVHQAGGGLAAYESKRSRADEEGTVSRLSPYLRFGQLSPRHLYHAVRQAGYDREVTKTFARRLHCVPRGLDAQT